MYTGPEAGGIAHLQSQGEGEVANPVVLGPWLTPTDRCPRDSNPGPLDLYFSILLLSHRSQRGT